VVGGVGGVLLVAVAFWIWWRKRHQNSAAEQLPLTRSGPEQPELPGREIPLEKYSITIPPRSEMEGQYYASKPSAASEPGQLATQHGVSELEG
jgi:hypothetical protein